MTSRVQFFESIDALDGAQWNRLLGADHPFLRHEFLRALESTGCVGEVSGWIPRHAAILDDTGTLLAAAPLYLKTHSWGEFVFDWSWADAYQQHGLPYYPKLVCAVPFTPVAGARLLAGNNRALSDELVSAILADARDTRVSSVHFLFTTGDDQIALSNAGLKPRIDCRFAWRNRGYRNFDDFLSQLTASRRKKIKRERRRIRENGISFKWLSGDELDTNLWNTVTNLCANTFLMRGQLPYINARCFIDIARQMPQQLLALIASDEDGVCAAAVFFRDSDALYGRYWGTRGFVDCLHFETCYYQGIEYCIDNELLEFDPGTQGEHKLIRGFAPSRTWSWHWFADTRFSDAIQHYLDRERMHVDHYIDMANTCLPYRRNDQETRT